MILLLALQAAVAPAHLKGMDRPTMSRASTNPATNTQMSHHDCEGMAAPSVAQQCPHCTDKSIPDISCTNLCAGHCAALTVAMLATSPDFTVEFPHNTVTALSTRSDIPPIPPPIA